MIETAYQLEVKPDGRVQLPLELRRQLQLQSGSRLVVRVRDAGHAELITTNALAAELRGYFKDGGPPMVDELLNDRRQEAQREQP